jgi:aspartyl-tRNA(Asn)/glutamyl-tRNA(Gln) amidotransferase subunit A
MSDLNKLTIAEARDHLRAKEITAQELTQSCLAAIDGADALGAFVHKTHDLAMTQAQGSRCTIGGRGCARYVWNSVGDQRSVLYQGC